VFSLASFLANLTNESHTIAYPSGALTVSNLQMLNSLEKLARYKRSSLLRHTVNGREKVLTFFLPY